MPRSRSLPPAICLAGLLAAGAGLPPLAAQDSSLVTSRGSLTGTVLAETGSPLSGAEVVIDSAWYARTDPEGRFRIAGLPRGAHVVQVRAIGFEPLELDFHVGRGAPAT